MDESIVEVSCEEIRVSPFQPRRHFSEDELEELAASIRSVGLIQPPVVRRIQHRDQTLYYELIAGERRWRAAKKAGLSHLKVIVRDTNEEHAAKTSLIENIQRVDLNPIELAQAFRRLIEVFQMTQEGVAEQVGKKRSTIANYLRLLALPTLIQENLAKGMITMGHAKAILSLENDALQQKLHELITKQNLTVREAERASRKMGTKKKREALSLSALQEKMQERLGTKVVLSEGKIAIHYYSLEDLERLLELLGLTQCV